MRPSQRALDVLSVFLVHYKAAFVRVLTPSACRLCLCLPCLPVASLSQLCLLEARLTCGGWQGGGTTICDITILPFPLEQQELPARGNLSLAPAPAVPTALHSKMDELEGQLLAKVLALEKERAALSHGSHQQRQEVEKELDALQGRVAELEHGRSWGAGD